jgi:hypothetical protein
MKTIKHYDWLLWITITFAMAVHNNNLYNGSVNSWPTNTVIFWCSMLICTVIRMRASD